MRAHVVDPSAFTPPYDHALCAALGRAGVDTTLVTSRFLYDAPPTPEGYAVSESFYRHAVGPPGSLLRRASKLLLHAPDMLSYRRRLAEQADVVHFQWLDVQWMDVHLLPRRPLVLTAHDLLPREARPGQVRAQRRLLERMDAVIAHSAYGARQLTDGLGLDARRVHVIHHGAFDYLTRLPAEDPLPPELAQVKGPVTLFFGLLRPYKGLETLIEAWREAEANESLPREAELWIVGRPRMDLGELRARAPSTVRLLPRFVSEAELPCYFRRADVVVLPYARTERFDMSGVLATSLAFGKPTVLSDIGAFPEVAERGAARLVPAGQPGALGEALAELLSDDQARSTMAAGAERAARGAYAWDTAAEATAALYRGLAGT